MARKMVNGNALWERVLECLRGGLSPEQASGILRRMPGAVRISHESIYTALCAMPRGELRAQVLALLPWGCTTRRPGSVGTDRRGLIPNAKPRKPLGWKSPAELFLPGGSFDFQLYWFTIINPVALGT